MLYSTLAGNPYQEAGWLKQVDYHFSNARDEFRHLLDSPTRESDWQRFFSAHPYVLSMSLPLRLDPADIVPLGRLGLTEPDFIFYPKRVFPAPYYGVIELKKPSSQIVSVVRSNVAVLSRDAETAIQQATRYSADFARYAKALGHTQPLFLGNRVHMFVVMGMSQEISNKLGIDGFREPIEKRLPPNLQLIPYDMLLKWFESAISPFLYLLVPVSLESIKETNQPANPTKLYVAGFPYSTTPDELRIRFASAGPVLSVAIRMDKITGRSRAFGFVEMANPVVAAEAVQMWNGVDFGGRRLTVGLMEPRRGEGSRFDDLG